MTLLAEIEISIYCTFCLRHHCIFSLEQRTLRAGAMHHRASEERRRQEQVCTPEAKPHVALCSSKRPCLPDLVSASVLKNLPCPSQSHAVVLMVSCFTVVRPRNHVWPCAQKLLVIFILNWILNWAWTIHFHLIGKTRGTAKQGEAERKSMMKVKWRGCSAMMSWNIASPYHLSVPLHQLCLCFSFQIASCAY